MDRIEIPLSKTKTALILVGALTFIVFGILFLITPNTFLPPIIKSPLVIRFIGLVTVLFFGAISIYGWVKLFDKTMGLTIDETGITDNTNASSVGLIEWIDITEIKTKQVMSTKFILIYTNNPNKYLDRVNGFKRKLLQGNMKVYGTPFSITINTLRGNFSDVESQIKERLKLKS